MRYLTFLPDDARLYQIAHASLMTAPPPCTVADTRMLGKLLDKIEAVGVPEPIAPHFNLSADGGTVAFEDAEFAELIKYAGISPIQSHAVRDKIKLLDRLDAAAVTPSVTTGIAYARALA